MEKLLGREIFSAIRSINSTIYEIRIRVDRPIRIKTPAGENILSLSVDEAAIARILDNATDGSRYAYEDQIKKGYVQYGKGIRIGVVGESIETDNGVLLRKPYALCIRFAHEIVGCACGVYRDPFRNTLILSPPGGGKTTLLRDYARLLSRKYDLLIIDERYEICGDGLTMKGGEKSDIVQGVPKSTMYETAIRTMSPEVVVCDELFGDDDIDAVRRLSGAGIKVLATYHSDGRVDAKIKNIFPVRIYLSKTPQCGSIVKIEEDG